MLLVKLSCKKSLLVIQKISGLLVNTLTTDDKYSLLNRDKLTQPIQMQISKKEKKRFLFYSVLLRSRSSFEHVEKKMSLKAYIFPKVEIATNVLRYMSKKSRFT